MGKAELKQLKKKNVILTTVFSFLIFQPLTALASPDRCSEVFLSTKSSPTTSQNSPQHSHSGLSKQELVSHVREKIVQVPEFDYLRETAKDMGLRVWLFVNRQLSSLFKRS